jgi:ectoine hydroxylase-related dioxygenase (phytanoyl-CoA dioxygenase family)
LEQIEQYRGDGFTGPVDVLNEVEVARYRAGLEAFERDSGKILDFPERSKSYLLFDWADEIVHNSRVLDAVEDLIGPNILVYHLTMHIKEPATDAVVIWHQDDDYFRLDPGEQVTAWVALSDASELAGCMRMVPGTHRLGHLPHEERPSDRHLIRAGKGIFDRFEDGEGVPVPVGAGQMSLHHTHTVHCSGPNGGADRRIGVGVSYIPTHVRPKTDPRSSALLVRGEDCFGNFHAESRLRVSLSAEARAAHAKAYDFYMRATGLS